jgi:NAD(P)-dependent dehydrogenase (short-subunit alcohol dehydrogenase family)
VTDRAALVTGGTGLVGSMLVAGFLDAGYTVAYTSRSASRIAELDARLAGRGHGIEVDLERPNAAAEVLAALEERRLAPAVLVNAARDPAHLGLGGRPTREGWLGGYLLEVVVPYELASALAAAPGSQLRTVVNVGSMYGVVAPHPALYDDFERESSPQYGTAKAALVHLTKELAVRLGPTVRVNAISYGGVAGRADAEFERRYARFAVLGRMLDAGDVVGPALFLASDAASGVTGHNLVVDGGWSLW